MTGTAVLRGGLKNGMATTLAETVWRAASTVISMLSVVPAAECSRLTQARAIIFFSVGDQVVDVAGSGLERQPLPQRGGHQDRGQDDGQVEGDTEDRQQQP